MKKVAFSLLVLGFLSFLQAEPSPNANLSPAQIALVKKIEGFLEGMTTLQSDFVQVNPDNSTRNGVLKWLRPLKMVLEYKGEPYLHILCDGDYFTQTDEDGSQSVAISNTPASLLLSKNLDFMANTVIKSVDTFDGAIQLLMAAKDNPDGPSLRLIFSQSPFALRQWQTIDASGQLTDVFFVDPKYGVPLKASDFKAK